MVVSRFELFVLMLCWDGDEGYLFGIVCLVVDLVDSSCWVGLVGWLLALRVNCCYCALYLLT